MPKYSDDLLTSEEADLVISAIPLQALPEPWYVGDCVKCRAMVVDCCDQCERCRDCCICWGTGNDIQAIKNTAYRAIPNTECQRGHHDAATLMRDKCVEKANAHERYHEYERRCCGPSIAKEISALVASIPTDQTNNAQCADVARRVVSAKIATVPRDQRCGSGWHVTAKENCNCGPYKPCVVYGCPRQRTELPGSRNRCYEHMRPEQQK